MAAPSTPDVLVLGAGLTGLATALELRALGARFRLLEREARVGGHATTTEEAGYRFDRTGHLLHLRDPDQRHRVLQWLGDDHLVVERRSAVYSHGVYTRYPFQANTFGLPPEVVHACLMGFIEAHFATEKRAPRDFEEFAYLHFGKGIAEHFMLPYNERLWGVAPRDITPAWCQRFVPLPRLEDVVAGAVGLVGPELGYNASFVYPRLGIDALPTAMHRELGQVAEVGVAPLSIDPRQRRVELPAGSLTYGALVSTLPLPALVSLLVAPPAEVVRAARALRATHLYYLDVALRAPPRKPFHWVYVPEAKYPFYRVGAYTSFSSALAPPGCGSLYVELASREPPDLATLVPTVVHGLTELGFIGSGDDVAFTRLRRLAPAYVIYDHEYERALAVIKPFLEASRIVSTGRYGGWNYSSMEDALIFGGQAARRAIEHCDD